MAHYLPKTLAKTLTYIAYLSPYEYGLFWNPDGTMPWKEFYWALQEDASLRFVRESHIRELTYLGLRLPFVLDGGLLRLKDVPVPVYSAEEPPVRLFHACKSRQHLSVLRHGLSALRSNRPFFPLSSTREAALRIGKRHDPTPLLIECLSQKARADGILFRRAGPELYLVESLAPDHLVCPPVREEIQAKIIARSRTKRKSADKELLPTSPGSFFVNLAESHENSKGKAHSKEKRKGVEWKRGARKDRHKRTI